jgi:dTDP-4-amino-4,6-dideoxygalactose transaminase
MSRSSRWVWERADWERIRRVRQRNYVLLHEAVSAIEGARPLTPQRLEGACPWVLPVLVNERDGVVRSLRERGVGAYRAWARWEVDLDREAFVDAQYLRDHVLALPIHQDLTQDDLYRVSRALQETVSDPV